MKLTGARVNSFLSSPPDHILGVLFFGPDRGLVKERSETLASLFVDNPDDAFAATVLTSDDLQTDSGRLSDEMVALSLLGDTRLVRVRLDHERPGAAIAKIIRELDAKPENCAARLLIEAGELTPRSAVRKCFEAAANFAAIGCYAPSQGDIANMIRTELNTHAITIDRDALEYWLPLLQGDRALLRSEIEKMALYKGYGSVSGANVTLDDVQRLAAGAQSSSIDDIIMAALSGSPESCDRSYRTAISGKINPALILRSLQRQLTRLLEANAHMEKGDTATRAMQKLRPPVFKMQERQFSAQLHIWPAKHLKQALSQSLEAEQSIKTAGAPTESLTGRLLLALARYAQARK